MSALPEDVLTRGFNRMHALAIGFTGASSPAIGKAALVLEKAIKEELSKPGTGRLYSSAANQFWHRGGGKRTKRRKPLKHRASAPGEPPAVDLGDLRRSIGHEIRGALMRVGSGLERAPALEFGHVYSHPTRVVKPRPFMRPALVRAKREMREVVTADLYLRGQALGTTGSR